MMPIRATRYHDISCGHRVVGHESKCKDLHGHNYRVHFTVEAASHEAPLDTLGRVLDFGVIKTQLCEWLECAWDHRTLIWSRDPWLLTLETLNPDGVVAVPFNPTAEHMAQYLGEVVGPGHLNNTGCVLVEVIIEETRKCSASWALKRD